MTQDPIQIDGNELYESRLIILLETGPQTNEYDQIILTKEDFETISKAIKATQKPCTLHDHHGEVPHVTLTLSDDFRAELNSKIKSHYNDKEI